MSQTFISHYFTFAIHIVIYTHIYLASQFFSAIYSPFSLFVPIGHFGEKGEYEVAWKRELYGSKISGSRRPKTRF